MHFTVNKQIANGEGVIAMSQEIFSVECPCGSILTHEEFAALVVEVQAHAKGNHNMDLTVEDIQNMASN